MLVGISIYRVVDDEDIVTTLLPEEIFSKDTGCTHVGEVHLQTAQHDNAALGWLENPTAPPNLLTDHAPANYVDIIKLESPV